MSKAKGLQAIYQWVIKTMMKDQTGVMQTLPKKDLVDFNVAMTTERLMREGVDPTVLKNANQVENAINMIENKAKTQSGITKTKTAEVFDLEGRKIDTDKGIMGGRQIPDDDLPPPGSRGGDDDIAAPIQSEDELLEKLNRENKEATRNLQIKLSKDKGYQKFKGETEEEIRKRFGLDDPDKKADGGRIGYKIGSIDKARRAFLKTAASIGAGIGALKTGMLGLSKEAAPAVEKAVETVTEAPSYFFDLVAKIKLFGKPGISVGPRQNTMNYKNYELMEDVSTGDIRITKQKGDPEFAYEEEVMEFRKGKRTEDGVIPDEYEEATIRPDGDGKMKDIDIGIEPEGIKEIIEEATKEAPSIKKASGGIARMLGE